MVCEELNPVRSEYKGIIAHPGGNGYYLCGDISQEMDTYYTTYLGYFNEGFCPISSTIGEAAIPAISIGISPNPAREYAEIEIIGTKQNAEHTFQLFNTDGKLLKTASFIGNKFSLERDGLPSGIYFFRVAVENKVLMGKLVF